MYSNTDALRVHIVGSNGALCWQLCAPILMLSQQHLWYRPDPAVPLEGDRINGTGQTRRSLFKETKPKKNDVLRLSTHKLSEIKCAWPTSTTTTTTTMTTMMTTMTMAPHFFFTFGLPDVQGLLPQLRANNDPLTLPLRCASGAGVEDCAPETLRQYSLRSKGTVMSTTPVS